MTTLRNPQYFNPSEQRPNHPPINSQRPISIYDNYLVTSSNYQNGATDYTNSDLNNQNPNHNRDPYQAPIVTPEEDVEEEYDDENEEDKSDSDRNICDISDSNKMLNNDSTKLSKLVIKNNEKNSLNSNLKNQTKNKSSGNINSVTIASTPSLTYCLNTTVPQNISASRIAGRHAPTRNSLRHSRMIVMGRSGRAEKYKRKGLLIRRQGFARFLAWLQTVLGFSISMLALWLLLWAPNISPKVNPYWSAVPLSASGVVGLLLLGCCQRRKYKDARHFCAQASKILSIFLAFVACITCTIAASFATIHFLSLTQMICAPEYGRDTTCICHRDTISENDTSIKGYLLSQTTDYYHYIDLSCPEVDTILNLLLLFSAGINAIAVILTLSYLHLHWKSRNLHNYTTIRTNDNQQHR